VWEAAGSKTTTDHIQAKLKKILARHKPPLPDDAAEKIAAILREAEARPEKR
jgi:trimethylamine:corrinoid methyltransferase-like protein